MKERSLSLLPDIRPSRLWVRTFHATCLRILKEHAVLIGFKKDFSVLDETDKLSIIKKIIKKFGDLPGSFTPKFVIRNISNIKNSVIDMNNLSSLSPWRKAELSFLKNVFEEYENYCIEENIMDFDSLITNTIKLFETNKDILDKYKKMWKYTLVDEFQDINLTQYKLIKALTDEKSDLTVVGDDDQSIYRFRGAIVEHILNFPHTYKKTKIIRLGENYRCPKDVVSVALSVIKNNKHRHKKDVYSNKENKYPVELFKCASDLDEARGVVNEIESLFDHGFDAKDIAVLFRTNSQSRIYEKELIAHSIAYKIIGGLRFFERSEVKDAAAYLRLITDIKDNMSLRRVINLPSRGFGEKAMTKLERFASASDITLWQALLRIDEIDFTPKIKKLLKEFVQIIEETSILFSEAKTGYEKIFEKMLSRFNYFSIYDKEDEWKIISVKENITELFSAMYDYITINESSNVTDFLNDMTVVSDLKEKISDGITLMTVHNAKGLEFPVVFLTGLETGVFPHYFSLEEDGGIEEERRLCYVGITRAKTRLYLSYALRRRMGSSVIENTVSPFVLEIPRSIIIERNISFLSNAYIEIDDDAFDY